MSETINIDLSNYKDRLGQRVQPGRYKVIVEDAEVDTARSGNTMINLWFRLVEGEFEGATITDRLVLTEKSLFRVVGFMQAIGIPTPKKRLQVNLRQFIGKYLEVDVDDGEPYNGRVRSEVRGYLRLEKGATEGATSDLSDLENVAEAAEPDDDEVDLDSVDLG